jgi:putative membrane protein
MAVTEVLVVYLHFAAMILIAVFLAIEYLICVPGLARQSLKLLARVDLLYLIAAVLALATGVARLVWFGKGAGFYLHNPVFYLKLALFVAVGLISIPPTMQYLRWMRMLKTGAAAVAADFEVLRTRRYLLVELVLFAFIPLLAVLMARGIGIQTPAN